MYFVPPSPLSGKIIFYGALTNFLHSYVLYNNTFFVTRGHSRFRASDTGRSVLSGPTKLLVTLYSFVKIRVKLTHNKFKPLIQLGHTLDLLI